MPRESRFIRKRLHSQAYGRVLRDFEAEAGIRFIEEHPNVQTSTPHLSQLIQDYFMPSTSVNISEIEHTSDPYEVIYANHRWRVMTLGDTPPPTAQAPETCAGCGKPFDEAFFRSGSAKTVTSANGTYIACAECEENCETCYCGKLVNVDEMDYITDQDRTYYFCRHSKKCANKIATCARCGTKSFADRLDSISRHRWLVHLESNAEYECSSCRDDGSIKSHSYKPPKIRFFGEIAPFFGAELEVDNRRKYEYDQVVAPWDNDQYRNANVATVISTPEAAVEVTNILDGLAFCKRDGSIGYGRDEGFEVVSHPISYESLDKYEPQLRRAFEFLNERGFYANPDTCGMHVHISRKGLQPINLYRILNFFKKNWNFIVEVSGRKNLDRMNTYANMHNMFDEGESTVRAALKGNNANRRAAVNMRNKATIEFRIFESTLDFDVFLRNIEFCVSMYHFSRDSRLEATLQDYNEFLQNYHKRYPRISKFTEEIYERFIHRKLNGEPEPEIPTAVPPTPQPARPRAVDRFEELARADLRRRENSRRGQWSSGINSGTTFIFNTSNAYTISPATTSIPNPDANTASSENR